MSGATEYRRFELREVQPGHWCVWDRKYDQRANFPSQSREFAAGEVDAYNAREHGLETRPPP